MSLFTNRYFLVGLGLLSLIALTFVAGAWLDWSLVTRLLIVIGLLVVGVGILAYEFVRANRSANQIEQSIKMQAEQQRVSTRPDKQAEIEELQEQLETAIGKLKQSKLGRGRRGSAALHALPWYMFVGPPAAGKTTAIKNSGLNFPVGTDGIRGVGGTRNCDWFFSDAAILLDTAGRYMTEHEDEEEWHAFLDMLKEHRNRRPINGVLIGISITDLVDAAPDEIESHASNIRRRVSELVERLGVRFPVYLVFTKCDLMQGFVEFFGDMTRKEREQIWGCTLTDEEQEERPPRDLFEREFDRLFESLVNARTERLRRSMKRDERRKVYVFPLEMRSAKQNLSYFIDQLFQPNPYQENPEFRGFYFTSGTQEGAPIDRVIQSIGRKFDLPAQSAGGREPATETKSYFIRDLFTDVVIPDQYRVEQTSSSARRGRLVQAGTTAAAVLLLALFTLGLMQASWRSQADVRDVESAAAQVADVTWQGPSPVEDLERVDGLRQRIDELRVYEEDPPFLRWGLYRGGALLEPAETLYFTKTRALLRRYFQALETQLNQGQRGPLDASADRQALEDDLKAYLLLTTETDRLSEPVHRQFLTRHLAALTTEGSLPGSLGRLGSRGGQVEQQIDAFIGGLASGRVGGFEGRSGLIQRVQTRIYTPPTIANIYTRLKNEAEASLTPVTLDELVPRQYRSLFAGEPTVSGFFTQQGWEAYVRDRISEEGQLPEGVNWWMGQTEADVPAALQDRERVAEDLRERYFSEYAQAWTRLLRTLQYTDSGGMRATSRALNQIGNPFDSPLLHLLARVTDQTTFQQSALQTLGDRAQQEAEQAADRQVRAQTRSQGGLNTGRGEGPPPHPVNQRMAWLHRLEAPKAVSGGGASNLTQALQALQRVGGVLDGMVGDPPRAAEYAAGILAENGGELRTELRTVRSVLQQMQPDARRELFEAPILTAWRTILGAAQGHLNERWRDAVYRPYQATLDGLYPFDVTSSQDASLNDFSAYFHPQSGAVATFTAETLAPFVDVESGRVQEWEGAGIGFSRSTREMLRKAEAIGQSLFVGGALQLSFRLQADQPERGSNAPPAGQVYIDVHGREDTYRMGQPRWQSFAWPGNAPGASLEVTTQEGPLPPKRFDGDWAWFRLLQEGQVEPRTSTEYRIRWPVEQPARFTVVARYNLRTQQAEDAFLNARSFFRFQVPETIN
jgi:type VI secretion system protein ImpL